MSKLQTIILLTTVVVLIIPAIAIADGSEGCTFCGTVSLDGSEVAGGTLVTAVINGDEYNTHTPLDGSSSRYCITIRPPDGKSYPDGTLVVFKVKRQNVAQTGSYKSGASISLDLTNAAGSTTIGTSSNLTLWLTVILSILILIVFTELYLLIRKRRLSVISSQVTQVPKPVSRQSTPQHAIKSTPRPQETVETRSRYVWDSETLRWMPNTKSAEKAG